MKPVAAVPCPAIAHLDAPVAHTLTLEFGRRLTDAEWQTVVAQARQLPYVQHLRAGAERIPAPLVPLKWPA